MVGLIELFVLYSLCLLSAILIERRIALNSLVKRIVLMSAVAAGQLMLSVQLLSLLKELSGPGLLLANLLLTSAVFGLAQCRPVPQDRLPWSALWARIRVEAAALKKDVMTVMMLAVGTLYLLIACWIGWAMIPFGDLYHYEMPLFWIQNHSIAPFPVHNPRIVAFAFLSEALAFPGYLYARTPAMHGVFTVLSAFLTLGVVFSLARRLGAGFRASICAAAMTSGFSVFALQPLYLGPYNLFAGVWFGASLLFLIDSRSTASAKPDTAELGCSVLCFLLACGSKNTTALLGPLYLAAMVVVLKRSLLTPRVLFPLAVWGGIALVCSGVPHNYIQNRLWFGNAGGPTFLQDHLGREFTPSAVWTRLCRGAVLLIYDTIWIPNSAKDKYVSLCQKTATVLGAEKQLREDDDYYGFNEKITPRSGAGLLGVAFLIPAALFGAGRGIGIGRLARDDTEATRFTNRLLVLLTVGSFVMVHLVLRWQYQGLLRLMIPFVVVGTPLCAFLLEKQWARLAALLLLIISTGMFMIYLTGNAWRHLDIPADRGPLKFISRLQNTHARPVQYRWQDHPPGELMMQEDYSYREIYQKLLTGIPKPSAIGFIGNENAECFYLFGPTFGNRVIPLVDARTPGRIAEPPPGLDYLVAANHHDEAIELASQHGFDPLFEVTYANRPMLLVFKKPLTAPQ